MSARAEFLYGVPGAEEMEFDAETVLDLNDDLEEVVVEKWTVRPVTDHLPDEDSLLDWLSDWIADNGEGTEGLHDAVQDAIGATEVTAAAKALIDAIGSKVTYCMADKLVGSTTYVRVDDEWREKAA